MYLGSFEQPKGSEALGMVTLTQLQRPTTATWLQRELQALLLEEDVDLIVQHVLGTLVHAMGAPKRLEGREAAVVAAAAAAPYLPGQSSRFGQEFAGFLASGLNVAAYDDLVARDEEDRRGSEEEPPS